MKKINYQLKNKNNSIKYRQFIHDDRSIIRSICCETGNQGYSIDNFFSDKELFADLVSSYYTDFESESTWVAEYQNQVIGYLTGCLDTYKYNRFMKYKVIPKSIFKSLFRKAFWSLKTWVILKSYFKFLFSTQSNHDLNFDQFSAHFHINIIKSFRHQGIGNKLINIFLEYSRSKNISGIYVSTFSDNAKACLFFQKMGFKLHSNQLFFLSYVKQNQCKTKSIYTHFIK